MAIPRGVHRSFVNRYGPRTPAGVVAKSSVLDANGGIAAAAGVLATPASGRASLLDGQGRDLALVGSSRPLLELVSCTACAALDEELKKMKSAEQMEVRSCVCVLVKIYRV